MTDTTPPRMTKIEEALELLALSVVRLEGAAQDVLAAKASIEDGEGGAGATVVDPEMTKELEALRTDYDNLKTVSRAVSGRLDGAIERLRTALEQ
ncbi:MAG: hypothetical protein ACPGOY_13630 [Rhodospirillaceae bacterium]